MISYSPSRHNEQEQEKNFDAISLVVGVPTFQILEEQRLSTEEQSSKCECLNETGIEISVVRYNELGPSRYTVRYMC